MGPIPTSITGCRLTIKVGQFESADSVSSKILNMINTGCHLIIIRSALEQADLGLESANYGPDFFTDPAKNQRVDIGPNLLVYCKQTF